MQPGAIWCRSSQRAGREVVKAAAGGESGSKQMHGSAATTGQKHGAYTSVPGPVSTGPREEQQEHGAWAGRGAPPHTHVHTHTFSMLNVHMAKRGNKMYHCDVCSYTIFSNPCFLCMCVSVCVCLPSVLI